MKQHDLPTTTTKVERGRYKLWALATILVLALCSMFTGTVTLKSGDLNRFISWGNLDSSSHSIDLDVLEIEEREKVVKQMWDVYMEKHGMKIPRFWQQAFQAAYQDLTTDDLHLTQATLHEIAKISIISNPKHTEAE